MARTFRIKNNAGQFQKYASSVIKKQLQTAANEMEVNLKLIIADELEKKYKENVQNSFSARTIEGQRTMEHNKDPYNTHKEKLTYHHTGIFLDSIHTEIDGSRIKVMIRDELYPDGASTTQVYKWLTKGTKGGEKPYPHIKHSGTDYSNTNSYGTGWSVNYPTPRHEFEEHTMLHMLGFMETLKNDIRSGKYSNIYRYSGRKKKRTHYKGNEVR